MNVYVRMNVHKRVASIGGYRVAWLASQHNTKPPSLRRWAKLNVPSDLDNVHALADGHAEAAKKASQWRGIYRWRMMTSWMRMAFIGAGGLAMLGVVGHVLRRRRS